MDESRDNTPTNTQLRPSQFYGEVIKKHYCSDLVLAELRHPAARSVPEHSHEVANFCVLLAGDYSERVGVKTVRYDPLTVVFYPPALPHRVEVGEGGGHFFSIEMAPSWMERLREYSFMPKAIMPSRGGDITWLATRLYREFLEPELCSPLAVEGLVMAMLADTARQRTKDERRAPRWLVRAVDLIQDNFRQIVTISGVAAEVGIHPFHLSKVFRQFHKQSVSEFVNHLRIQFACRELGDPRNELADVALAAGFSDQSHFTRVFRQVRGVTPGAYRTAIGVAPARQCRGRKKNVSHQGLS